MRLCAWDWFLVTARPVLDPATRRTTELTAMSEHATNLLCFLQIRCQWPSPVSQSKDGSWGPALSDFERRARIGYRCRTAAADDQNFSWVLAHVDHHRGGSSAPHSRWSAAGESSQTSPCRCGPKPGRDGVFAEKVNWKLSDETAERRT